MLGAGGAVLPGGPPTGGRIYVDQMFNLASGTATSLTALLAGTSATAGPYVIPVDGRLLKITLEAMGNAATSLIEAARVELTCTLWSPNTLRFALPGGAIRTAPAVPIPAVDFVVDQPVTTAVNVTGNYAFHPVVAVSGALIVLGTFSVGQTVSVGAGFVG